MTTQLHSVVLGAGLMGRLLAHSLARLGHRVDVYEAQGPDAQGAAARVAAAICQQYLRARQAEGEARRDNNNKHVKMNCQNQEHIYKA